MKKGIAIVIPGADYSARNLGKVTFSKTIEEEAAEIVSAYSSNIGTSMYNDALNLMVIRLMQEELWEGLDIYPMLGTSLDNKLVNINPNSGFIGLPLIVPSSATASENGIMFVRGENEKLIPSSTEKVIAKAEMNGLYNLFDEERTNADTVTGSCYLLRNSKTNYSDYNVESVTSKKIRLSFSTTQLPITPEALIGRNVLSVSVATNKQSIYANGIELASNELDITSVINNFIMSNGLGVMWEGYVRFFVQGIIPVDKHSKANEIFKEFLNFVKPMTA